MTLVPPRLLTVALVALLALTTLRLGGQAPPPDHIERHDDRVLAFATHLGAGLHELTYLVRATTAGTFYAPGARAEAMYAPEVNGRSAGTTVTVK